MRIAIKSRMFIINVYIIYVYIYIYFFFFPPMSISMIDNQKIKNQFWRIHPLCGWKIFVFKIWYSLSLSLFFLHTYYIILAVVWLLSCVGLFCNSHGCSPTRLLCPWDFSRQEWWNGLPFPSSGGLPNPGIESTSPILAGGFFAAEPPSTKILTK